MPLTLGINGFGRIGRLVFRSAVANPEVTVLGINDPAMDLDYMLYQLKYDSVHKRFPGTIAVKKVGDKEFLVVNGVDIAVFRERDPAAIPWGVTGVEFVCDSTGVFLTSEKAQAHIAGGAKKKSSCQLPPRTTPQCMSWV